MNDINITQNSIKTKMGKTTNNTTNFLKHDLSRYHNDKFKICYYS
jgi:hypothetical protein